MAKRIAVVNAVPDHQPRKEAHVPMAIPTIPVRMRMINGEWMLSASGGALLFGVPFDQINGRVDFPQEWIQQARRRTREAKAHTDSEDITDILAYWAAKDYDAVVEFVYEETP